MSASWVVRHEAMAVGTHLHLLSGGWPRDVERSGWVMTPWKIDTGPHPLIWPQQTPFVGGQCPQAFHLLPQKTGLAQLVQLLKEKKQEDQVAQM